VNQQAVLKVDSVSKKFCRSLRQSLWYGVSDLAAEFAGRNGADRVRLRAGEFVALDKISFELGRGECLGLLGANGAGKSTLLKLINGLIRPDAGQITVCGRVRALIELGTGFSPILTGRENIYINGAILGFSKEEIEAKFDEIVEFAELRDFIDAPVRSYSSGMQVRLAMAVAAHLQAEFLLVDEVLAVGDIAFRMKCFQHFLDLKNSGKSIIVVSHNMSDISRVCDRVIVLNDGTKAFDGAVSKGIATYEELLAHRGAREDQRAAGAASIERVDLLDSAGNPCTEFETGNDLCAEVTLRADRHLEGARLVVDVATPSLGVLGAFSSPHKGFSFDIPPTGTVLRFAIRKLPLLVGSYSLRLYLYGSGIKDFQHAANQAALFKIVGPPVDGLGFGVGHTISFDHDWQLRESVTRSQDPQPQLHTSEL